MADENKGEGGEGSGGKTPPPEEKKPPAPAPKEPKEGKPEPRQLDADSDDIPENDDLFTMSKSALQKRLGRHTRKELRERFGTDDFDKIKADLAELSQLREERDKRRKAAMSEQQRLQEERDEEKKKREKAEADLETERTARTFERFDGDAESILSKYVDPDLMEEAVSALKKHVASFDDDDKELDATKKLFEDFAKELVKKRPKFAKAPGEEKKPEPKKIPLTTGGGSNRPERANPNLTEKTPKPGQPNSMSKGEYQDYKRRRGLA